MKEVKLGLCTRQNTCFDCDNTECTGHGDKGADCSKWNKEYGDCDEDQTYCIGKMDEFFKTHELYKAGRKAYYEIWKCREKVEGEG